VSAPTRKRGPKGRLATLALDARFRGHDENAGLYANFSRDTTSFGRRPSPELRSPARRVYEVGKTFDVTDRRISSSKSDKGGHCGKKRACLTAASAIPVNVVGKAAGAVLLGSGGAQSWQAVPIVEESPAAYATAPPACET
jgi:hypothetical protein